MHNRVAAAYMKRIFILEVCHLNMDTLEVERYPENIDLKEWEFVTGKELDIKHPQWKNVLGFDTWTSSTSFRIMENFAKQLDDEKVSNRLLDILEKRNPSFISAGIFITPVTVINGLHSGKRCTKSMSGRRSTTP